MAQWDASDMFKQMYGEYSVFRLIKAIAQHTCTISGGALRTIDKYIYIYPRPQTLLPLRSGEPTMG